jgi:hypothetical protein
MSVLSRGRVATLIVGGLAIIVAAIAVIRLGREDLSNLEPCHAGIFMPTIRETGLDSVTLSGEGGLNLSSGQAYTTQLRELHLRIELLDADEQGATFLYNETVNSPGEDETSPQSSKYYCKQYVSSSDMEYRSRKPALWPQPRDFTEDWTIEHYMEFNTLNSPHRLPSQDYYTVFIQAEHQAKSEGIAITYEISIDVSVYAAVSMADAAYKEDEHGLTIRHDLAHRVSLASHFDRHVEYCYLGIDYACSYVGRFGRYVLAINVNIPHEKLSQFPVPLDDWQYLVKLIESRVQDESQ